MGCVVCVRTDGAVGGPVGPLPSDRPRQLLGPPGPRLQQEPQVPDELLHYAARDCR